jgi:hypothetical protein
VLKTEGASSATRSRIGGLSFWISAALMLGAFQLYQVAATKETVAIGGIQAVWQEDGAPAPGGDGPSR